MLLLKRITLGRSIKCAILGSRMKGSIVTKESFTDRLGFKGRHAESQRKVRQDHAEATRTRMTGCIVRSRRRCLGKDGMQG